MHGRCADDAQPIYTTRHAFCDIFHEFLIGIVTTTQINDAGIIKNNKNINKQTLDVKEFVCALWRSTCFP